MHPLVFYQPSSSTLLRPLCSEVALPALELVATMGHSKPPTEHHKNPVFVGNLVFFTEFATPHCIQYGSMYYFLMNGYDVWTIKFLFMSNFHGQFQVTLTNGSAHATCQEYFSFNLGWRKDRTYQTEINIGLSLTQLLLLQKAWIRRKDTSLESFQCIMQSCFVAHTFNMQAVVWPLHICRRRLVAPCFT